MASALPNVGKASRYGDLKRRLLFLLAALVVFRIGAHIPVPGIDPHVLGDLFKDQQGGILGMFNIDRKSTRLNSSHLVISYAVFCLKKKKNLQTHYQDNS